MRAEILAIGADHLGRDRRRIGDGQRIKEAQVRLLEPAFQRVAIDDFEPGNGCVVIELSGLRCLRSHLVSADDLALDQPLPRAFYRRVEQPLDGIGLISGGELAWLALERRIGREKDALAQFEYIRRTVVLHQWHRLQCPRHQFHRPREVVVIEHRLINVGDDVV